MNFEFLLISLKFHLQVKLVSLFLVQIFPWSERHLFAFCWVQKNPLSLSALTHLNRVFILQIAERTITRIPFWVHEKNRHEQDVWCYNCSYFIFNKYFYCYGLSGVTFQFAGADITLSNLFYFLFQITENCIRRMGRSLQDVITEWTTKLNNREIGSLQIYSTDIG